MRTHGRYVLNEVGDPVPEPDLLKWGQWFETADRQVAFDTFDGCQVSTVFLALDHQLGMGPPILWETLVSDSDDLRRYSSRLDALKGHAEMLSELMARASAVTLSPYAPPKSPQT